MRAIYKYQMASPGNGVAIEMPIGARIVHLGMQDGAIMAWAEVTPDQHLTLRRFVTFGTGREFKGTYVGTVLDGTRVWHVIEL